MNNSTKKRLSSIKHLAYESTSVPAEDVLWLFEHLRKVGPSTAKEYKFPKYACLTDLNADAYVLRRERLKPIRGFVDVSPGPEVPIFKMTFKMPQSDAVLVRTPYIQLLTNRSLAALKYLRSCTLTLYVNAKKLISEKPIDPYLIDQDNRAFCAPVKIRVPSGNKICYSANVLTEDKECAVHKYIGAFFTDGDRVKICINGGPAGFHDAVKIEAGLTAAYYTTKNVPGFSS